MIERRKRGTGSITRMHLRRRISIIHLLIIFITINFNLLGILFIFISWIVILLSRTVSSIVILVLLILLLRGFMKLLLLFLCLAEFLGWIVNIATFTIFTRSSSINNFVGSLLGLKFLSQSWIGFGCWKTW